MSPSKAVVRVDVVDHAVEESSCSAGELLRVPLLLDEQENVTKQSVARDFDGLEELLRRIDPALPEAVLLELYEPLLELGEVGKRGGVHRVVGGRRNAFCCFAASTSSSPSPCHQPKRYVCMPCVH